MIVLIDDEPSTLIPHELDADVKRRYFHRCRFKGGGSTTVNNTSTYTPTEYELQLQKAQADYADAIAPNSLWLNDTARKILQDSIGAVQVDFNGLNNQAQQQIGKATNNLSALTGSNTAANAAANNQLSALTGQYGALSQGQLPTAYQKNMQDAIASTIKGTMGQTLNSLGQRGVINSSVTNTAMNDISKNAADTVAQQYQNNIQAVSGLLGKQAELANNLRSNTLNTNNQNAGIYNNLISNATQPIATAGAAQEAAQTPATNLWNASLGLNQATTGALAAAAGKGTTSSSSTQNTSGGGGFFSGLLGGLF